MSELDAIYALHDQAIADRDALLELNADLLYACKEALAYLDKYRRSDDLIVATILQNVIAKAKAQP